MSRSDCTPGSFTPAIRTYASGNLLPTTIGFDAARYWVRSIDSGPVQLTYGLYDLAGNVRQIGDARPNMDQTFTYDPLDRLAPNRTYTYTPQNMLATVTVFGAQTQFAYDADNWRFSKTSADGTTLYFRGLNGDC